MSWLLESKARLKLFAQATPAITVDHLGNAIVVGALASGDAIGIVKYSSTGRLMWSVQYRYQGDVPRLVAVGDRVVLVGSQTGSAHFGDHEEQQSGMVQYHCEGQSVQCSLPSRAIVAVELDAEGSVLRLKTYGSLKNLLSVSSVVALADGQVVVTGEFIGEPMNMGYCSLCEMSPGMPPAEPVLFQEGPALSSCTCSKNERDLFVLQLNRELNPAWAKTLSLGLPEPRLATDAFGRILWSSSTGDDVEGLRRWTSVLELDKSGRVRYSWTADGAALRMSVAADGTPYISDNKDLKRLSRHASSHQRHVGSTE